ncbi:MAG: hypothetical protein JO142_18870 [Burkholderiales bacterium]|nr:hypothetical protein [Burkholderiales bacterium]
MERIELKDSACNAQNIHHLFGSYFMAKIVIENFDQTRHSNPIWYIDSEQRVRYERTGGLAPYRVCLVEVCGFEFTFHSTMQIELCLEYYSRQTQPTSRLPVYRENLGGDHWETQRWFEKLPLYLLEKSKRPKVVAALDRALDVYRQEPGAQTSTTKPKLWSWSGKDA